VKKKFLSLLKTFQKTKNSFINIKKKIRFRIKAGLLQKKQPKRSLNQMSLNPNKQVW